METESPFPCSQDPIIDPIWSQMNPAHILTSYFFDIHILSSHLCLSLQGNLFSSCFPTKSVYAFLLSSTPRQSYLYFRFNSHNNNWCLINGSLSPRRGAVWFRIEGTATRYGRKARIYTIPHRMKDSLRNDPSNGNGHGI
jgi:hypothetical protein